MSLDVIGTGFGRTGTNSLKLALEQLGFGPRHHIWEVFESPDYLLPIWMKAAHEGVTPDWDKTFKDFRSTVDWPTSFLLEGIGRLLPQCQGGSYHSHAQKLGGVRYEHHLRFHVRTEREKGCGS